MCSSSSFVPKPAEFSVWLGCDESECWHYFGAKLVDRGATVNLDCCVPVSGGCVLLLGLATLLALVSPVCILPWGCHVFVGSLLGSLGWSGFRWLPPGFGLGCLFWGSPFSYPRLSLVCCGAVCAWWGPGAYRASRRHGVVSCGRCLLLARALLAAGAAASAAPTSLRCPVGGSSDQSSHTQLRWRHQKRWVTFQSHTCAIPLQGPSLPQGDPLGPLVMTLWAWAGWLAVERRARADPGVITRVFVDDRSFTASRAWCLHDRVVAWSDWSASVGFTGKLPQSCGGRVNAGPAGNFAEIFGGSRLSRCWIAWLSYYDC